MKTLQTTLLVLTAAASAFAQTPSVAAGGIFNAASYAPAGLPNAPIAQGSLFVVFGSNMGPAALQQINSYPLPTTLAGTSLTVTVSGTSVKPLMVYTSAAQIAAVLPSATPVGTGTLTVTFNGATSAAAPIQVVASSFGMFTVNQKGSGAAIVTDTNFNVNAANGAANPGDAAIVWGTGLGPVPGDEAGGALPGDLANIPAEVYIGGKTAAIIYRGRSGCCAGLDQIVFTVPAGAEGCSVPVAVKIGNIVSNFGAMAIAASGRACSDPNGIPTSDLQTLLSKGAVNLGSISLFRSTTQSNLPPPLPSGPTTTDTGSASFTRFDASQASSIAGFFTQTSFGACTINQFSGQGAVNAAIPAGLDAGPTITIAGAGGSRQLQKVAQVKGLYSTTLGTTGPNPQPLFLDQGTFTADNGTGGADVGKFAGASVQAVGAGFTWTNQASIADVDRSKDQTVTWSNGAPNTLVTITGFSSTAQLGNLNGGGALFVCVERAERGTFQIPAVVLLSLPVSTSVNAGGISIPTGSLSLMNGTLPVKFTAPGLDYGTMSFTVSSSKSVNYK
ncbi:MAG: hypothetical protein M3Z36_06835 [Acidobacteriota bacterium]|nr:hypothetical protein [Acidobacteriota bacterium]